MADPKNSFDFGTGSIDKDQWQRDIDNELDEFITRYTNATNKKSGLLLRQAFQDLRRRIASGDMLNRTADGLYQFGSALNRDNKDMTEAYQRALGFMGGLARRQIQAPPVEPEKKAVGSLEERYIKSLNPSGKFNTEAYWKNLTDEERRTSLKNFLNKELRDADNYQDFGGFGDKDIYTQRLQNVMNLLESGKANDWSLQQLGFTKNWLQQPTEEQEEPKSRLELAQEIYQAAIDNLLATLLEQQVAAMNNPTPTFSTVLPSFDPSEYWTYDSFSNERDKLVEALKYLDEQGNQFLKPGTVFSRTPKGNGAFTLKYTTRLTPWNGQVASLARNFVQNKYINDISSDLNNYFRTLGVSYLSYIGNRAAERNLMTNLAKLFAVNDGKYVLENVINNLFAKLDDGKYGLKGSTLSYDPSTHTLYNGNNIDAYKEGGILKGLNGLIVDDSYYVKPTNNVKKTEETPKLENSEEMDTGDWITILGTTAADIGSMLSANAVGAGTAVSAGLGVTSTLGNSVNDFRHGNIGSGLANLGIGLTTDLIGLIPGFGAGAKGYKIGRTLTRFARPLMAAFTANNLNEAGEVLGKGVKNGFGSLTALDWTVLTTALTSIISRGKSAHTRLKNVEFVNRAVLKSSPRDAKGNITNHIINEQGFVDAGKELLGEKRFGFNTPGKQYTKKLWNSIPKGGEIKAPYYARPIQWQFGFGKAKKLSLLEKMEEFIKNLKKSTVEAPVETNTYVPDPDFTPIIRLGGKLKALRKGGIIKAKWGDDTETWGFGGQKKDNDIKIPLSTEYLSSTSKLSNEVLIPLDPNAPRSDFRQTVNFGYLTPSFFIDETINQNNQDADRGDVLKASRGRYSVPAPEGKTLQNYKSAMDALLNYYKSSDGKFIMGDVYNYYNNWLQTHPDGDYAKFVLDYNNEVKWIRDEHFKKFQTGEGGKPLHLVNEDGWSEFNLRHHSLYPSYGEYDSNKEDYFGESTWRRLPNAFDDDNDMKNLRTGFLKEGDNASYIHMKNDGTLELVLAPRQNPNGVKEKVTAADEETEKGTAYNTEFKNPLDPTPGLIAGKTALGLLGNRNIYGNLLDEMPQAPLRDPIDRKLAIVGWQERIKHGQNELADLRNATWLLHGYDPQTNFAKMLETERVGRDVSDKAFMEDSGRLFETAGKSWNLDNEDILYNIGVGDANRKAIADRARMMAQIRAAWRSGDNNILMGALSDTGNWLMKKYQREQDLVDKVKEVSLGSLESYADWALRNNSTYKQLLAKKQAGTLTEADRAKMLEIKMSMLDQLANDYANKYYSLYHTPFFGGGLKESLLKDGGKMEIAKLKARSKDNDRYVSMMKDMRKSSYRRRRR